MKSSIMNLATKLAMWTVFATGLFMAAQAQTVSGNHYKADVPFQFSIGNKVMPAGTYFVDTTTHFIRLTLARTNRSYSLATANTYISEVRNEGVLVFNVYSSQHFLTRMLPAGSRTGLELPKGDAEREIAELNSQSLVHLALK
jgi:hypothetical protein